MKISFPVFHMSMDLLAILQRKRAKLGPAPSAPTVVVGCATPSLHALAEASAATPIHALADATPFRSAHVAVSIDAVTPQKVTAPSDCTALVPVSPQPAAHHRPRAYWKTSTGNGT